MSESVLAVSKPLRSRFYREVTLTNKSSDLTLEMDKITFGSWLQSIKTTGAFEFVSDNLKVLKDFGIFFNGAGLYIASEDLEAFAREVLEGIHDDFVA